MWNWSVFVADYHMCSDIPCKNGADCKNYPDSYECLCLEGYTGYTCEEGMYTVDTIISLQWLISKDLRDVFIIRIFISINFNFWRNLGV